MGNGAKLALVGVLALIVLVVAVWDRKNEEAHQDDLKSKPLAPLDPSKPGPRVKVVSNQPVAEDRMTGQITQGPLNLQGTLASSGGKTQRPGAPVAPAIAPVAAGPSASASTTVPAGAPSAPAAPSVKRYTLKAHDTLASIAQREYGSKGMWRRIADANKDVIKDPNRLPLGKEIVIPPLEVAEGRTATVVKPSLSHTTEVTTLPASGARTYTVEKGDTLARIAQRLLGAKDRWKAILDANKDKLPNEQSLKVGQELVIPAK